MLRHTDIRAYLSFLLIHVARKSPLLTTYRIPHTSVNTLNISHLMLCRETIAICCTDRAEHTNQQWLFVARTVQNTQINGLERTQLFSESQRVSFQGFNPAS